MTAKQYLQQAFRLNQRIESNRDEIARLRSLATSIGSPDLSADRVQSSGNSDKMAATIAKIIDFERELEAEIEKYVVLRREIYGKVDRIEDDDYRIILKKRYLEFKKWENIAVEMNYSYQWVHKLHKRALQDFAKKNQQAIESDYESVV
ncbi:hypothetical protein FACS1894217_04950 [Clostridia bacterium]|nr:hypothetical protein FACS1894217_04950 [Clostridia bacterium]